MSASWLMTGGIAFLLAAAAVMLYVVLLVLRLLKVVRSGSAPDKFVTVMFPGARLPAPISGGLISWRCRYPGWCGLGAFALIALLFGLPLLLAWSSGEVQTPYLAIGGRLPWSDASGWLHGLYHVLNEGELTDWTVRRPLHLMYLSSLTLFSGLDLYGLLLLRTLMLATACALLVRELHLSFGAAAALVALAMLSGFAATFSPTTMSEASGLTFGAAALALLWRGVSHEQLGCYALGAGLMALALSVRTGPVFVLGGIIAWPLLWSGAALGQRLRWAVSAGAAIAAGAVLAWVWSWLLYSGDNMPGANFAFTLYGLAHGGLSWEAFYERFDLEGMSQGAQASLAYREAFAQIQAHPATFVEGMWTFTQRYIAHSFLYVPYEMRARFIWLFWIGLATCAWRWRAPQARLLILLVATTAATAPIIFWSIDAYRAFIVTAPIEAAVVAAAVGALVAAARGGARPFSEPAPPSRVPAGRLLLPGFGALLVSGMTILPAIALSVGGDRAATTPNCPTGLLPSVVELGADSAYLEVITDETDRARLATQIRLGDFRKTVTLGDTAIAGELLGLQPGSVIAHGYDLAQPRSVAAWIIFEPGQVQGDGSYAVCGVEKIITRGKHVFTVTFAHTVEHQIALP